MRLPLVGFVCLSEFYRQRRCRAYWVSVNPLRRYSNRATEVTSPNSTLRYPHRRLS